MKPLVILLLCLGGCFCYGQSVDSGTGGSDRVSVPGRDSLLIGKWVAVLSQDEEGQTHPERFEVEYLSNGKTQFNRAALFEKFNRQRVQRGNAPLSIQNFNRLFPRVTWKTVDNRIVLTFQSKLGKNELTYFYRLSGDTLTTVNNVLAGTRSKLVAIRQGEVHQPAAAVFQ